MKYPYMTETEIKVLKWWHTAYFTLHFYFWTKYQHRTSKYSKTMAVVSSCTKLWIKYMIETIFVLKAVCDNLDINFSSFFYRYYEMAINWPPQKEMPTSPRLRHIGIEIFRWSHSAALSPVHTAPVHVHKWKHAPCVTSLLQKTFLPVCQGGCSQY